MKSATYVADATARRKKNIDKLTLKILAKMLDQNVKYLDAHYIQDRTREILEKTINKLKFQSEEVKRARRVFLDVLVDGAKKQLYGFKDDRKAAKNALKDEETKEEAIKVLKVLDRMEAGNPADLTEERNMGCEPVCQLIAKEVLSKDLILKDDIFVNDCIEEDNETLIVVLSKVLAEELFDQLITSLDRSYILANEKNWGCRRDQIKLSQINNRIIE